MAKVFYTEVSEVKSSSRSKAPNGSSEAIDHYTVITRIQDWADVPENGKYRDRSYLIKETYISNTPHYLGQLISSSSTPLLRNGE